MAVNKEKNWIDEMIEREAIPHACREETVVDFCSRHEISVSTYYYQSSKTDNWKKILEICLMSAKKELPEVLEVLTSKAKKGEAKFVEMYLNYVIQLAKNLDIKTDGKEIKNITAINYILPNGDNDNTNGEATPSISSPE